MTEPEAVTRAREAETGAGEWWIPARVVRDLLAAYDALAEDYAQIEFAEGLTHQSCIVESHPDWYVNAEHTFMCPWCAKDRWAASVREREAAAWAAGHKHPWKRGPDDCPCGAWGSNECACGRYGTGELLSLADNPYEEGTSDD